MKEEDFAKAISELKQGRKIAEELFQHMTINDAALLIPDYDKELIETAAKYFPAFQKLHRHILVIQPNTWKEKAYFGTGKDIAYRIIPEKDFQNLMRYYAVLQPLNIRVLSLDTPPFRHYRLYLGLHDVDLDKIVVRNIYGITGAVHHVERKEL